MNPRPPSAAPPPAPTPTPATTLPAPRIRHHAVGAELVAPLHDRDVSAMRVRPRGELRLEGLLGLPVVQPRDPPLARLQPHQHLRQLPIARRPRHKRHIRRALEDPLALLLRHAAQHGEPLALALQPLVLIQPVEDLLLRLVADRAGVVQDQPRVGLVLHPHVPLMLQRPNHLLRVMGIHLASKRLDIESLLHPPSIWSNPSSLLLVISR